MELTKEEAEKLNKDLPQNKPIKEILKADKENSTLEKVYEVCTKWSVSYTHLTLPTN